MILTFGQFRDGLLSHVFHALFSLQSGLSVPMEKNLNALELELSLDHDILRFLVDFEGRAGNAPQAYNLRLLMKRFYGSAAEKKESKKLSDSAVEKMRSGDFIMAEKLIINALTTNPSNPEALISLCSMRLKDGKKEQALKVCQEAAESVYANPEYKRPGFAILAREAEFGSYEILSALGRKAEAKEALRRAVKNAPVSWPGLTKAKDALKKMSK